MMQKKAVKKKEATATKTSVKQGLSKQQKILLVIIFVVLLLIGGIIAAVSYYQQKNEEKMKNAIEIATFYEGIHINDIDVSGKTKEEALSLVKESEQTIRPEISFDVVYKDQSITLTTDDFSYLYDTEEIVEKAYQLARKGDTASRYDKVMDLKENPESFSISCDFDYDKIPELVTSLAEKINKEPVDAHVASFTPSATNMFTYAEGENGYQIDEEDACEQISNQLKKGTSNTITLKATEIPFKISAKEMGKHTQLISSYYTISTNGVNGNHNIALALSHVNGTEIKPGETFSYLKTIGNPGDPKYGWRKAGVISNGKLIQEYGGGVCQGATTVYGASLRAGLTIVKRSNHSWPSVYEKIGQDAAVSYPGQDLQIRNDTEHSVFLWAGMIGSKVTVRIYGSPSEEWDTISVYSKQTASIKPKETIYKDDPTLPEGTKEEEIKSRTGYRAVAWRVYYKDGVEVKQESIHSSYYRPIQGVTLVGTKKVATSKPETSKPNTSKPETSKPESSTSDTSQPESSETESSETE